MFPLNKERTRKCFDLRVALSRNLVARLRGAGGEDLEPGLGIDSNGHDRVELLDSHFAARTAR